MFAQEDLKAAGKGDITGLLKAFDSESQFTRLDALNKLATFRPTTPQIVAILNKALTDSSELIRAHAVDAIRKIGPPAIDTLSTLLARLKDPQEPGLVRWKIPETLMLLAPDSSDAMQAIRHHASEVEEEILVRWTAIRTLGEFRQGSPNLRTFLRQLTKTPDQPAIPAQAWLSLAKIDPDDPGVQEKILEMAKGEYGQTIHLRSSILSTSLLPQLEAFDTLVAMGLGDRYIPVFLQEIQKGGKSTGQRTSFAYILTGVLYEMGEKAKSYVPQIVPIIRQKLGNTGEGAEEDQAIVALLMESVVQVDPTSPMVHALIKDIRSNEPKTTPQPMAEFLWKCLDPQTFPKASKNMFCNGYPRASLGSTKDASTEQEWLEKYQEK